MSQLCILAVCRALWGSRASCHTTHRERSTSGVHKQLQHPIHAFCGYEDGCLLGCSPMYTGMSLPTFQHCLHHQGNDTGSTDLWNIGKFVPIYMALQPRRQPSSKSLPWEPQSHTFLAVYNTILHGSCFIHKEHTTHITKLTALAECLRNHSLGGGMPSGVISGVFQALQVAGINWCSCQMHLTVEKIRRTVCAIV
jgi:hypothetical protein